MAVSTPSTPATRGSRRDEILAIAVRLFAERGYHGVSMDDIGSAAGVTGPALYHHFAGKEAMLVAALTPVSQALLDGARARVAAHPGDPRAALESLVDFHVEFALTNPGVIAVHLQELDRLPEEPRREIRRLQRLYVEEWVGLLDAVRPDLSAAEARVLVHATFGLMNSTPFLAGEVDRERRAALLRTGALAALLGGGGGAGGGRVGAGASGGDGAGAGESGGDGAGAGESGGDGAGAGESGGGAGGGGRADGAAADAAGRADETTGGVH